LDGLNQRETQGVGLAQSVFLRKTCTFFSSYHISHQPGSVWPIILAKGNDSGTRTKSVETRICRNEKIFVILTFDEYRLLVYRDRYSLPVSLQSKTPPPFCSSGRPVSHMPQASFLGGTPLSFATRGTQGEQFVGRAERPVPIVQRTNFVTNLLAFEDRMAVLAAQQQVLAPISRVTMWTKRRQ
jgi:hypothetical protein